MVFKGWPAEALEFYEGLEADNSKVYWTEHKDVYERDVYAPMAALLADLAPEFGEWRIFRPYRDVRFSANKEPYKTNIAATIGDGYVHLGADGLMAASGMYMMAADQLERYRHAVADHTTGPELEKIIHHLETEENLEVHGTNPLKTSPKGHPKDHPRVHLLRYKGVIAMKAWPVAPWLGTATARTRVAAVLRGSEPLIVWLDKHVGSSMLEEPRRH
jgi:uncharacterized protein (TIGR02453 family)